MTILERVQATPEVDWPVAKADLSGPKRFFGLYGGEHIAATEFVIGATLVQYGCSASDILLGLAIGNLMAVLCFALLCAPIAVKTRLSLYTFLGRVAGINVQKIYNVVFGLGFAALGATGICISATAIRQLFNVPIQHEWYPTSLGFIAIVLIFGAVVVFVAANGFEGISAFAARCVPWMICLFGLAYICLMPELARVTGYGAVHSPVDFFNVLDQQVWNASQFHGTQRLGFWHVAAFAWTCNVALHIGLNDMAVLRYAKKSTYGYISAMGMFIGHYFAWIGAGIMGAAAALFLNTDLGLLDSGEVTFTVLGYAGILGVIIAGWTTANPTIYRVSLSMNAVFKSFTYKKMTYLMGTLITIAACFPVVQQANNVLTYLGLLIEGMGVVCITEFFVFPKIGFTQYWNLYRKSNTNWAALLAWAASLIFFALMFIFQPIHQNFWFIPEFFVAMITYIVLAAMMGAKKSYPKEQEEEHAYVVALQTYANEHHKNDTHVEETFLSKLLTRISFVILALMIIYGITYGMACGDASLSAAAFDAKTAQMKTVEFVLTVAYFVFNGAGFLIREFCGERVVTLKDDEQ